MPLASTASRWTWAATSFGSTTWVQLTITSASGGTASRPAPLGGYRQWRGHCQLRHGRGQPNQRDITNTNGTGLDMCVGVFEIVDGNLRLKGWRGRARTAPTRRGNVAKGPVVVRFNHCVGQTPVYATEWWDNKATGFTADVFTLAVGVAATGKDAVMGAGGNIAGTVTRESNGNPISGALVRSLSGEHGRRIGHDRQRRRLSGQRPAHGHPHKVRFSASGFAVEWYNGKTTQSTATNVSADEWGNQEQHQRHHAGSRR